MPIGTIVSAGAGLLGNLFNTNQQKKANQRSENFSREMYGKQRADSLSDWHMQNAYNDPSAQMQRLKSAGLNPNLVYGTGADAQAQSAPRSSNASQPDFKAPRMELGSVAMQAMQAQQLQANIARTEAETERIQADTTSMLYQNQFLTPEMFANEYQHRSDKASYGAINEQTRSHIQQLEKETANLISGYRRDHDKSSNAQTDAPTANLKLQEIEAKIKNIMANTSGTQTATALKEYERQIIQSFGISGGHAGMLFSNILKLILLKR